MKDEKTWVDLLQVLSTQEVKSIKKFSPKKQWCKGFNGSEKINVR